MSKQITVGLLPLYIKLYDDVAPAARPPQEIFAANVSANLEKQGFKVISAPVCRIKSEFDAAVKNLENAGCEVLATLHLAYSPSLESIEAISSSQLPVVILDTTPDASFDDPAQKLMGNHGIHGVQDLGNMLLRRKKPFLIAAGACDDEFFGKASKLIKAAAMAFKMTHLRIGSVGGEFAGMGDFQVPRDTFGMTVIPWQDMPTPDAADIAAETAQDLAAFDVRDLDENAHRETVVASLKLRNWIKKENLDAFTICFLGITRSAGWATVPFLECSKAMTRGLGYAGEGDVLTAGLHAALFRAFPDCGFSEMFCPDWVNNRIFTSHMGEINLALAEEQPVLTSIQYKFSETGNPAVAYACYRPGKACWVNLAPGADGKFTLISAPVEFLPSPENTRKAKRNSGWFRPVSGSAGEFLEKCTEHGMTHHAVAVYDCDMEILRNFSKLMNWDFVEVCS